MMLIKTEFQIQLGSKLMPEYPCKSITGAFYHLRKALILPMFHQHSMAFNLKQYRDRQFVFGLSMEKVPDSSYTEIDTALGNYYTSTVIDNGFYTQTQINNNFYNKTETDDKIDNLTVYSQTAVDAFLSYKEDKTRFVDNISFFPIIDCSRPSILHARLTLKNSTVNVEPLEGLLFSNQFGAETDRDVAVFKNQTNYITLKGNKINAYATHDDSIA